MSKPIVSPALARAVAIVDPKPQLEYLEARFGIPPDTFAGYVVVRPGRKKLYLVTPDHQPPSHPRPRTIGLPFLRIYGQIPKLSMAAALQFGHAATRNIIEAEVAQAEAFLTRRDFWARPEQLDRCTGRGYVLVRYRGQTLGVGFLFPEAEGGRVESLVPKAWARDPGTFKLRL
ncbi:hypothetical protein [Rhodothermus bifroesti]|uniref:rRNA small subunit methyltransferase F RNA-binding PUA-like domain-containing protein n=1 Tax=Rhodothermus marinus TaxID=29549 RepID=A0A7V2F6E5_RHOMR|nr:hypothetical protein [Rhodothermus bifroesti]GBD02079.1 hypothetical protein HRbin18_01814 [bacterium HR18]